jgi:FKBP-type peptidyl-prolyl cis-trans isomerase FkpA
MKSRFLLLLSAIAILASSCLKDDYDPEKQATKDDKLIRDFIAANNISAVKHESGLYYQIIEAGTGASVNYASTVEANYKGRLLNGNVFDQTTATPAVFPLNGVIAGWTIGVPLINVGGKIRLLIPSTLAYGNQSPGAGIPKNSVLDFDVELVSKK